MNVLNFQVKLVAKSELIEVSGFGGRHTIMRKGSFSLIIQFVGGDGDL